MWDIELVVTVLLVFVLAGFVKGVIGMGLPTVSVALLILLVGVKQALALMLIPSIATNVWQGALGGHFVSLMKRLWPMFAAAAPAIWLGAGVLAKADALLLAAIFGVMLAIYSASALLKFSVPAPGRHETWLTPAIGATTGFITGLTGSFVVPAVLYLQALGLSRDALVQAMGIAFTISTFLLGVALLGHSLLPAELGLLTVGALVPSAVGMVLGQKVRQQLSEERFRQVFFAALLGLGLWLAARPLIV